MPSTPEVSAPVSRSACLYLEPLNEPPRQKRSTPPPGPALLQAGLASLARSGDRALMQDVIRWLENRLRRA